MANEWTEIAQAVGSIFSAFISLVGLPFIYIQIRQANLNLKQSYHVSLYSVSAEINRVLLENPELKPFFYDNKELAFDSEDTKNRVFSIAELYAEHFESILLEQRNLSKEVHNPWFNYMRNTYLKSSALRKFMERHQDQYSKELCDFFSRILVEQNIKVEIRNCFNEIINDKQDEIVQHKKSTI